MDKREIQEHLEMLKKEQKLHELCWKYIQKLRQDVGLTDKTYTELKGVISGKIAKCERDIIDYGRLL